MKSASRIPSCAVPGSLLVSDACERFAASGAVNNKRARLTALVVVDENCLPLGIFTERDVIRRVVDKNLPANATSIEQVMTRGLKVVNQGPSMCANALKLMIEGNFRHVPVVDNEGVLVSMLDVMYVIKAMLAKDKKGGASKWLSRSFRKFLGLTKRTRAQSASLGMAVIGVGASISQVCSSMAAMGQSAVLCKVDEKGSFGIITERDIATRVMAKGLDPSATLATSVCTRDPVCVSESIEPRVALRKMMKKNYRHLPVKSSSGFPVAILDVLSLARCAYRSLAHHENATGSSGRMAVSIESGIASAIADKPLDGASVSSGEVNRFESESADVDGGDEEEDDRIADNDPEDATSEATPEAVLGEHEKNAISMLLAGNFTGAKAELTTALEEACGIKKAALLARRASVTSVLGDLEKAIEDYESALALLENEGSGDEKKQRILFDDCHAGLCESLCEIGRYEFAGCRAKAIKSDAKKVDSFKLMSKEQARLKQTGNELYSQMEYSGALAAYTGALRIQECLKGTAWASNASEERKHYTAVLYCNRAAAYIRLNDLKYALRDCIKATNLNPKYVRAWIRLCSIHQSKGLTAKWLSAAEYGVKNNPGEASLEAQLLKARAAHAEYGAKNKESGMKAHPQKAHAAQAAAKGSSKEDQTRPVLAPRTMN